MTNWHQVLLFCFQCSVIKQVLPFRDRFCISDCLVSKAAISRKQIACVSHVVYCLPTCMLARVLIDLLVVTWQIKRRVRTHATWLRETSLVLELRSLVVTVAVEVEGPRTALWAYSYLQIAACGIIDIVVSAQCSDPHNNYCMAMLLEHRVA